MKSFILSLTIVTVLLASCRKAHYEVPTNVEAATEQLALFPDYTDVVIPPNIAPMNFMFRNQGEAYVVAMKCGDASLLTGAGKDGKVMMDSVEWRSLMNAARGKDIEVKAYVRQEGKWKAFPAYRLTVAEEPVDAYLSYRLIEPGYELYRQLGLYQRNLTTYDQKTIYENNRKFHDGENHCVNCHNYKNHDASTMLFHVRGNMGGTLIAKDGKVEKINMKNDSILSLAVYPSWHARKNWVVFSSNKTGQTFHLLNKEKIEVVDNSSDLIFYNADTHELCNIIRTPYDLETFPCWNPQGDRIYYCVTHMPSFRDIPDSLRSREVVFNYMNVKYDLMSIPFDEATETFGEPEVEFACSELGKSASVPRVSPDGRYVLFTMGDYGQFHIWHKSADLYVKDTQTGDVYPLTAANSNDVDAYHSWSSNGRWIAFSSRRDDGSFTRAYIAYFDHTGKAHKAFMLPQRDPEHNQLLFKSYNVPEFSKNEVPYSFEQFRQAIYEQNGLQVSYKEIRPQYQ